MLPHTPNTKRASYGRQLTVRVIPALLVLGSFLLMADAQAETKLDFWYSYTHQPSGEIHYSFRIANYKRGLFFGSCGPSTRSLQWEYDVDLAGNGPTYEKGQMTITSEGKKVDVVSGTITIDMSQQEAVIDLRLKAAGASQELRCSGTYRIKKLKS